jgi:ATP-dependent helicase/nuclease subunit A
MTRARDELYICGYEGKRPASDGCWYKSVHDALKPKMTPFGEDCLRLGAEPLFAGETPVTAAGAQPVLPDWIGKPVALFPEPRAIAAPRDRREASRVSRGIFIHRILQQLPDVPEEDRAAFIAQAVQRAGAEPGLAADLAALVADPVFTEIFAAEGMSEVPLIAEVAGLTPQRRRIDRLVVTKSGILIADYKTDRDVPADVTSCNPDYIAQMAAYRAALRKIHPGAALRLCLLWTEAPKLMFIPDDAMDRMADQLSVTRP